MPDLSWDTLDTDVSYSCPGFDVVTDSVRLPDGTETTFDYLDEPPAVVILPFTDDGDVVLVEEWRQAVGRVNRGLPAGSVEDGESLEAAARRELAEETGYTADTLSHGLPVEPLNGASNAVHHHFTARGCTPDGEQDLDHDESIRPTTTGFDALHEAVLAGEVRDGRTALAVLRHAAER